MEFRTTEIVGPRMVKALLIVAYLGLLGCSQGPKLGKVAGSVTLDGKPLADAIVTFAPADGQMSHGTTDQEGRFTMKFADGRPGAMLGDNEVRIETFKVRANEAGGMIEQPELVPANYNSETELIQTVVPGDQEVDFDLSSQP